MLRTLSFHLSLQAIINLRGMFIKASSKLELIVIKHAETLKVKQFSLQALSIVLYCTLS